LGATAFRAAGADPNSEADGDRLNNRQEFIAGTDPTNSRSLLMIGGGLTPPTWC
jgi:hypothetical protein